MIFKMLKYISFLSFLFGIQTALAANCNVSTTEPCKCLEFTPQSALILMNSNNDVAQPLNVTRGNVPGNVGAVTCNFFITISYGGAGTIGGRILDTGAGATVPIQMYSQPGHSSTNLVGMIPDGASLLLKGSITGTSSSGNCISQSGCSYYPWLNTSLVTAAGTYNNQNFDIALYSWDGTNLSSAAQVAFKNNVTFKYTKDSTLSLSMVNTGSAYDAADANQTLDFGTLTSGESLGFDLWLVYSSGYNLTLASTNNGNLKNTAVTSSNLIPYTLTVGGTVANFASTSPIKSAAAGNASPAGGTKFAVLATIGTVGSVYSGTYGDTVTFTISAP